MRQSSVELGVVSMLFGGLDVHGRGVLQRAQDADQVGQVQQAVVVRVHLLHEHVAVGLRHNQVVFAEENHEVQRVDLHSAPRVDALKHVYRQEVFFLGQHVLLEFCVAGRQDLLSDDRRN